MEQQNHHRLEVLLGQQGRMRALARALVRDAAAADDVVQEALLQALRRPTPAHGGYTSDGGGWFARVVRNLALDRERGERRRVPRERDAARPEALPSVTDALVAGERQRALVDAVLALEEPYRGALLLRWFEELPPREVARRTGQPLETVKKQLQRGLVRLREALEERFGDQGSWAVALLPLTGQGAPWASALGAAGDGVRRAFVAAALLGGAAVGLRALVPTFGPPRPVVHEEAALLSPQETLPAAPLDGAASIEERVALQSSAEPIEDSRDQHRPSIALAPRVESARAAVAQTLRAQVVDLTGATPSFEILNRLTFELADEDPASSTGAPEDTIRFRPDADGWIEFPNGARADASGLHALHVVGAPWVIVKTGTAAARPAGPLVFVAPTVHLAGVLQDSGGGAVAGAQVRVHTDARTDASFPFDKRDTYREREWSTVTDDAGRFELLAAPTHTDCVIVFTAEERGRTALPTPERDATEMVVRLEPSGARPLAVVRGRVVESDGSPVASARVTLHGLENMTDANGNFALESDPSAFRYLADLGAQLVAVAVDGRFASCALVVGDLGPYELRLSSAMKRISGRLLGESGAPLAGVKVLLFDGTRNGSSRTLEAAGAPGRAGRGVTDADGQFELDRLLDRSYTLRFLGAEPFLVLDALDIPAGTEGLVVRVPVGSRWPRLAGRVVGLNGRPLAGITVRVCAFENAPGPAQGMATGPICVTDADGRFELVDVPRHKVHLELHARPELSCGGIRFELADLTQEGGAAVVLALDCDVDARLRGGFIGASLSFLDARGEMLQVKQLNDWGVLLPLSVRQEGDGGFGRLLVSELATSAALRDADGQILRTTPVALSPIRRNQLDL